MNDIFTYENYRDVLRDFYTHQKAKYPGKFSFRYFSREAGFKASNFLQLIMKGKRNLSYESIKKISEVMDLHGRRHDYFENLVLFNQAQSDEDKTRYYERMVSFKEYQNARMMTDSQKLYFSRWYYPVIREMVKWPNFKADPEWIVTHLVPQIKIEEAENALQILKKLKLIESEKNLWRQKDIQLTTRSQGLGHEITAFHRRMIQLAYESLNKSANERDISGITMSINAVKFKLIQTKIEMFREEIQKIIQQRLDDDEKFKSQKNSLLISQVCQLNIQFFKLAVDKN